jgi:hypothetical protein
MRNMNDQQQQQEQVTIQLGDIATLVQVIDVVSQRGGFQGQELAGVGMLRNKLEMFVRQNSPEQEGEAARAAGAAPVDVDVPPEGPLADKLVG